MAFAISITLYVIISMMCRGLEGREESGAT